MSLVFEKEICKTYIRKVAFSNDGRFLSCVCNDPALKIFSCPSSSSSSSNSSNSDFQLVDTLGGDDIASNSGWSICCRFSEDNKYFSVGGAGHTVLILLVPPHPATATATAEKEESSSISNNNNNTNTFKIYKKLSGFDKTVSSGSFHPFQSHRFVSSGFDGLLNFYDLASESSSSCEPLMQYQFTSKIISCMFSPSGQTVVCGTDLKSLVICSSENGKHIKTIEGAMDNWIHEIQFASRNLLLATGTDKSVRKFTYSEIFENKNEEETNNSNEINIVTDVEVKEVLKIEVNDNCYGLASDFFIRNSSSPAGVLCASASYDEKISVYNINTGNLVCKFTKLKGFAWHCAFSTMLPFLACATNSSFLRIFRHPLFGSDLRWRARKIVCLIRYNSNPSSKFYVSFQMYKIFQNVGLYIELQDYLNQILGDDDLASSSSNDNENTASEERKLLKEKTRTFTLEETKANYQKQVKSGVENVDIINKNTGSGEKKCLVA